MKQRISNKPSTQPSTNVEVIVVDGGSHDITVEIPRSLSVKVISSSRGRALRNFKQETNS